MEPKTKNKLPLILVVIASILLVLICGAVVLATGALAFLIPARTSGGQPEVEVIEETPLEEPDLFPFSDLPGMPVHDVRIEIGVGSPIPVEVIASGEWSSVCAQLVETNIRYKEGNQIHIELLADPGDADCGTDVLGLPFSMRIPLNVVELEMGSYMVNVNGVQTNFEWNGPLTESQGHFPDFVQSNGTGLLPFIVQDARVEIQTGSPVPVEVVVAGEWPNLCAQVAQVKTSITGQQIAIELLATPEDPTCPADNLGLPFVMRIPLHMTEKLQGSYNVTVNGLQTSFDWPPAGEPEADSLPPVRMALIGPDGNVFIIDLPEIVPSMVTGDSVTQDLNVPPNISYNDPRLSSDGRLVAYRRGEGVLQEGSMSIDFSLWVSDLTTGENKEIYDMSPAGFNWQPGSHLLAYIPELEGQYFIKPPDEIDPTLAKGIMGYDADRGETLELVKPERGYALYNPVWSPDGRFLSFDEMRYYEGRGPFAYYDFATAKYISWEEPLGMYTWSPDGEAIAYDNQVYTPTGEELILIRTRQSGAVSEFSQDFEPGYAIQPSWSPQGDRIAYLVNLVGPDTMRYTLFVQEYPQGDPISLGEFEQVYPLNWSPDGTRLIFSSGSSGEQWITEVNVVTGEVNELIKGMQPSVAAVP